MSSTSDAPSVRPGSIRSSILKRIPRGYNLTVAQSDTNSTMSSIPGPGRMMGALISLAGRRLEKGLDRIAEEQLGLGPNMAALRFTSALHDIHVQSSLNCVSDHSWEKNDKHGHVIDRLIWVCNGYCSRCFNAYLPGPLLVLPEPALKSLRQLVAYIQSSQPAPNIALAAVYIRIILQSRTLHMEIARKLDLLENLKRTRDTLWSSQSSPVAVPDEVIALRDAVAACQDQQSISMVNSSDPNDQIRKEKLRDLTVSDIIEGHVSKIGSIAQWGVSDIAISQLLTTLSMVAECELQDGDVLGFEDLLRLIRDIQHWPQKAEYLAKYCCLLYFHNAAKCIRMTARSRSGFTGSVYSVGFFSLEDLRITSGNNAYDRTVQTWDTKTDGLSLILGGQNDYIMSIAFAPDGTHMASGSYSGRVRIWNVVNRREVGVLHGHTNWVYSVAFSPDGRYIASGSADNSVRLRKMEDGSLSNLLAGHTDPVKSVTFSHDSLRLASASDDRTVRLWNTSSNQLVEIFRGHSNQVLTVAFSPNNEQIISGSADTTLRLWQWQGTRWGWDTQSATIFRGHEMPVNSVAYSPDGAQIVSGSDDQTVRLWDAVSGQQIVVLHGHSNWVHSVAFSPDAKQIASGSRDGTVRLWSVLLKLEHHLESRSGELTEIKEDQPSYRSRKSWSP